MPSKVWERLRKGGSLLGDPEERMMAEGQDGNTPGSGLVKVCVLWAVEGGWGGGGGVKLCILQHAVMRGPVPISTRFYIFLLPS